MLNEHSDLDTFHDVAWQMLEAGVVDRRKSFHVPALATIGVDNRPKVRTVVLRGVDADHKTIRFHTDARSAKVGEIARNPHVEMHFYDADARIQLRVSGKATAHGVDDGIALEAWNNSRSMSHVCYRVTAAPGVPIPEADAFAFHPRPQVRNDPEDPGRAQFRVVVVDVTSLELVYLHLNANRRARFDYRHDSVVAQWLVP
jgi:pyridoxamine 5'-phosphate oxidase